ncbi:ankyrin repeat protein, putative [Trichomonas vaginalis G3]|uniref:Ankyrin repeat protein, putative n=1 Tax=Trichomonas vaginalis (strain ATCC PRA-98 / G3) TaxID=412133 RepID=A2FYI4_TRIV3|nr:lipid catabolic process [Trichomonas vaginalis G3]EAX90043.1 ankyrin repeat protein, putative [Trichomonas vaginalis G3]KAI5552849.1 lipid catabolic process [Trichomonas vaginalis G3]|eukprot:XP_001302973.1 ankyrin repeat protein [Trichomonas vaginalis G3]
MSYAIASHNIDFVTFLMNEYNLKIDITDCIYYKNLQAFLVYLDKLNDVNKCVVESVHFNILSLCEFFITHGGDVNGKDAEGSIALHISAKDNKIDFVNMLLSHGANVNAKNNYGSSALHYAVYSNSLEIIEALISHGAEVNIQNDYVQTPFVFATNEEIKNYLKSHGAKENKQN